MNNLFRIEKYPKGWVVEIKKKKWYGKEYWVHYVSVAGIDTQPWYHSSFEFALQSLLEKVKLDVI